MTGKILNGRYEVHNEVGSGGMAIIYAGHDLATGWEVAIKVLRKEFANDNEFVMRFRREAQAVANLDHPNIVRVYDVGQDEGTHFIVMEFVHGISLKEYIRKNGPLTVENSMRICLDICGALKNAHDNGVIHRDVKPHNVLVSPDGAVKITDFGIAKFADTSSVNLPGGNVMGSVHYIPPEQARGEETDEQADIYSLGVTLYEMLTGQLPYEGDSTIEVARKHINEPLIAPEEINSKIPHSLSQVVVKAMAKDKKARYKSCGELARDMMRSYSDPNGNFVDVQTYQPKPKQITQTAEREREREQKPQRQPEPEPKRSRSRLIIVVGIIIILLATILTIVLLNKPKPVEEVIETVVVPSVADMTEAKAEEEISKVGLRCAFTRQYSSDIEANQVISQSPVAGSVVDINTTVRVVISEGPEPISVPSLYGSTREEAELALMDVGLELGDVSTGFRDKIDPGMVFYQDPLPNAEVMPGTKVDITINEITVEIANTLIVPDVEDEIIQNAAIAIEQAGFEHMVVYEEAFDEDMVPGTITEQDPFPNTEVNEKTLIRLYAIGHRIGVHNYHVSVTFQASIGQEYIIALEDNGLFYVIENGIIGEDGQTSRSMIEIWTVEESTQEVKVYLNGEEISPESTVVTKQ